MNLPSPPNEKMRMRRLARYFGHRRPGQNPPELPLGDRADFFTPRVVLFTFWASFKGGNSSGFQDYGPDRHLPAY